MGVLDKSIKQIMIKLLEEDEDVFAAVKRISESETTNSAPKKNREKELLREINELRDKNSLLIGQKELGEKEIIKLKEELIKTKTELKISNEEIAHVKQIYSECKNKQNKVIQEYDDYRLKYDNLDSIYKKYLNLGDVIIKRMERILNSSQGVSKTPEIFMAYGIQENNIVALWESIATNYTLYDSCGKLQDLIEIFQFFLELYKEIAYKNIVINWPQPGETYDERIHTRTMSSNVVGKIQKVILPGFSIGKSITKKAVVLVQ